MFGSLGVGGLRLGLGSLGTGGGSPFSAWIFASGLWADTGRWQDARVWSPAGLFMNEQFWWDTGAWQDAKVW